MSQYQIFHNTLLYLDKDANLIWDKLNEKEKQDFKQSLVSGDISRFMTLWQPWWHNEVTEILL